MCQWRQEVSQTSPLCFVWLWCLCMFMCENRKWPAGLEEKWSQRVQKRARWKEMGARERIENRLCNFLWDSFVFANQLLSTLGLSWIHFFSTWRNPVVLAGLASVCRAYPRIWGCFLESFSRKKDFTTPFFSLMTEETSVASIASLLWPQRKISEWACPTSAVFKQL